MDTSNDQRRTKVPKDGMGPRGAPECYYTSRVLNSTARYGRFVRRLRILEEEERRGRDNLQKEKRDNIYNEFFSRCHRRSLINTVAQRVDLCLASYEDDLKHKQQRLTNLLSEEEEINIRKFMMQAQEGAAALWQDKKNRLEYLLGKRHKEHQAKYAATPLSKCAHIEPCLVKLRAKEAQEVQLYQMREKQQRREAERELEHMWHELAMSEAQALSARMELDAMERRRRVEECARYAAERAHERRVLRDETRALREHLERARHQEDQDKLREQENDKLRNREKIKQIAEERKEAIRERQQALMKQQNDSKLIQDTWLSLGEQSTQIDKYKEERRKQQERDLDECNRKMVELKQNIDKYKNNNEPLILCEGQRLRDQQDFKRCLVRKLNHNNTMETRDAVQQQFKEKLHQRAEVQAAEAITDEYQRQVYDQLEELIKHKELTDAQARKLHQRDLSEQIQYNKLLKERAMQEELDQRKKFEIARQEYEDEIKGMLCRKFYSDKVHPFTWTMSSGIRMKQKCPCSPRDYCV